MTNQEKVLALKNIIGFLKPFVEYIDDYRTDEKALSIRYSLAILIENNADSDTWKYRYGGMCSLLLNRRYKEFLTYAYDTAHAPSENIREDVFITCDIDFWDISDCPKREIFMPAWFKEYEYNMQLDSPVPNDLVLDEPNMLVDTVDDIFFEPPGGYLKIEKEQKAKDFRILYSLVYPYIRSLNEKIRKRTYYSLLMLVDQYWSKLSWETEFDKFCSFLKDGQYSAFLSAAYDLANIPEKNRNKKYFRITANDFLRMVRMS